MATEKEISLAKLRATAIAKKWKGIDREDVEQNLLLWLYANEKYLERWRQDERGEGKLYKSLTREGHAYCAGEQRHRIGKSLDADNHFNIGMIQRGLPYIWELSTLAFDGEGLGASIVWDLNSAYYELEKPEQAILELRYKRGLKHSEIGQTYDITEEAARKRVDRALQNMLHKLNGEPLEWIPDKQENKTLRTVLELGYDN
jgi:DNA-directed RNA polymerase specialized sigma24 family protein